MTAATLGKACGRWPRIEPDDLRDPARLLQLARRLSRDRLLPLAESSLWLVFGAAQHALERGERPAALFAYTLRHPELITEAEATAGERRAREARANGRARIAPGPRPPDAQAAFGEGAGPAARAARAAAQRVRALGPRAGAAELLELLGLEALSQAETSSAARRHGALADVSVAQLEQPLRRVASERGVPLPG